MENTLPNLMTLESRIEGLIGEMKRLKEISKHVSKAGQGIENDRLNRVEGKIKKLIHLLDHFDTEVLNHLE